MPFSNIPTTAEGRAVHFAAFERALQLLAEAHPGALTDLHQDEMVAAIIEMAATGTTHIDELADYAVNRALAARLRT